MIRQLRWIVLNNPESAATSIMALTCANPGDRVTFHEVYRHSGRRDEQARADLARFTRMIRETFGRDQRWPLDYMKQQDRLIYYAHPQIAAWWNEK
jgi:hypothetical protein